jgi:hypothetical protein
MSRIKIVIVCMLTMALVAAVAIGTTVAGALQKPITPPSGTGPIIYLPPPLPPQPPSWRAQLFSLDEDNAMHAGTTTADRFWLPGPPTATTGGVIAARVATGGVTAVNNDPIAAGSSSLSSGEFVFPPTPMPANASMYIRVHEDGSSGSLCRTRPVSTLPQNDVPLHIIVAPEITKTAADLNAMVSSFSGWQPSPANEPNVKVYIINTTLTPQASSLSLEIKGFLIVDTMTFYFDYTLPLTLTPDNSRNVDHVVNVQQAGTPNLYMVWWGTPGDPNVFDTVKASFEPQLRSTVLAQAGPLTNSSVLSGHDVRWWTDQGFTLSLRQVSYSTNGIEVHAALCRLN